VVLHSLRAGPRRPGEPREDIGGISRKVLTTTLRRLQADGLVARERHAEAPPRVEYALTPLGRSLIEAHDALASWSFDHADEILEARQAQGVTRS
jgi:DNA-binding HxlR family transcriptional regulator